MTVQLANTQKMRYLLTFPWQPSPIAIFKESRYNFVKHRILRVSCLIRIRIRNSERYVFLFLWHITSHENQQFINYYFWNSHQININWRLSFHGTCTDRTSTEKICLFGPNFCHCQRSTSADGLSRLDKCWPKRTKLPIHGFLRPFEGASRARKPR